MAPRPELRPEDRSHHPVLRTVGVRATLWEALLPPEALVMPAELEAVDALLDDPRFFEPSCRERPGSRLRSGTTGAARAT